MTTKPNIIYILADDMGYGDVSCLNENSKIPDRPPGSARGRRLQIPGCAFDFGGLHPIALQHYDRPLQLALHVKAGGKVGVLEALDRERAA